MSAFNNPPLRVIFKVVKISYESECSWWVRKAGYGILVASVRKMEGVRAGALGWQVKLYGFDDVTREPKFVVTRLYANYAVALKGMGRAKFADLGERVF